MKYQKIVKRLVKSGEFYLYLLIPGTGEAEQWCGNSECVFKLIGLPMFGSAAELCHTYDVLDKAIEKCEIREWAKFDIEPEGEPDPNAVKLAGISVTVGGTKYAVLRVKNCAFAVKAENLALVWDGRNEMIYYPNGVIEVKHGMETVAYLRQSEDAVVKEVLKVL